jgi:hypothetical protein
MEVKLDIKLFYIAILLGVFFFWLLHEPKEDPAYRELLSKYDEIQTDYDTLKNKNLSYSSYLKSIEKNNEDLLIELTKYKNRKEKIKYVDRVVYQIKETVVEKPLDTKKFIYETKIGLPVCLFEVKETNYKFEILPVEYEVSLIKGENNSSVKLKAKSGYNGKEYLLPIDIKETEIIKIKDHKYFDFQISAGFSVDLNTVTGLEVSPTLNFPILHIKKHLDIATPKVLLKSQPQIGLDFANYNIGRKTKILNDTWLGVGTAIGLTSNSINITLTSKF